MAEAHAGTGVRRICRKEPRRRDDAAGQIRGNPGKPAPECARNIVAIAVPLVNRRRGGAGSLGDGTHGKSFLSSPGTEAAGGFEDTSFKLRISLSGQRVDSAVERISSGPRKII